MMAEPEHTGGRGSIVSPFVLEQIKDALRELRTAIPDSALADLVEAKIKALEEADSEGRGAGRGQSARFA